MNYKTDHVEKIEARIVFKDGGVHEIAFLKPEKIHGIINESEFWKDFYLSGADGVKLDLP